MIVNDSLVESCYTVKCAAEGSAKIEPQTLRAAISQVQSKLGSTPPWPETLKAAKTIIAKFEADEMVARRERKHAKNLRRLHVNRPRQAKENSDRAKDFGAGMKKK